MTFFPVRFSEVATVFEALPEGPKALTEDWLSEYVLEYNDGGRSWATVTYTLEKACSVVAGDYEQLESFERGHHFTAFLERLDALLAGLGIDSSFNEHFQEPFPDRPIALPERDGSPNVAFFSHGFMRSLLEQFQAKVPPVPAAFATLRDRLGSEEHVVDVAEFERAIGYTQIAPGLDWGWIAQDLQVEEKGQGTPAETYPLALLEYDLRKTKELIDTEAERTEDPYCDPSVGIFDIAFDFQACRMLLEWIERSANWVEAALDVATFEH